MDDFKTIRLYELFEHAKTVALRDVIKDDSWEYQYRKICRYWCEKGWARDISDVLAKPMDEVLQHFYESTYENTGDNEASRDLILKEEAEYLSLNDEEKIHYHKERGEEIKKDTALEEMIKNVTKEAQGLEDVLKKMGAISQTARKAGDDQPGLGSAFANAQKQGAPKGLPESTLYDTNLPPPESITTQEIYMSEKDLEQYIENFDPFKIK